jgi:hypothetical protein
MPAQVDTLVRDTGESHGRGDHLRAIAQRRDDAAMMDLVARTVCNPHALGAHRRDRAVDHREVAAFADIGDDLEEHSVERQRNGVGEVTHALGADDA